MITVGGNVIATVPEKYTLKDIGTPTSITSEQQYDSYVEHLLALESKGRLSREEESYAKILTAFINDWDETHNPIGDASPIEVLNTLIDANNLRQKDLVSIFGSESIVSEVLHQKRPLTVGYITKLSKRFKLSPAVFFPEPRVIWPRKRTAIKRINRQGGRRSSFGGE
jgi:HTH-type transcriptional regulator / antitoxin HigA